MVKQIIYAKIIGAVLAVVAVAAIVFILWTNPFGWEVSFLPQPLKIDKTANVVEEVKKISEFTTACYYEELVLKDEKMVKNDFGSSMKKYLHVGSDSTRCSLAMIGRGRVRAGYNLQKLGENDLIVHADTVEITLPAAEIFDVIINPSDYEIYDEEGEWSHEEVSQIKVGAEKRILDNAIQDSILPKAEKFGVEKITSLFQSFGFNQVIVHPAQ